MARKNFGGRPFLYPMPVLIIGSYDEQGVPNAMNAAWGCMAASQQIAVYLGPSHKTVQNILSRGAFTVSVANAAHVVEADYVGIVSGNNVPDKLEKANLHTTKSEFVDAPLIDEFPMALECKLISFDQDTHLMLGEIVNVGADESVLDEAGMIDPAKLNPICYDPVNKNYLTLGQPVGKAFSDGGKLK